MSRRELTSLKALQDHAEQTDKVCVMEGIALRQRQLSPDQHDRGCAHVPWSVAAGAADPEGGPESPVGG